MVQELASATAPLLLVDGYNVIFASRRLARLAALRSLDSARERLVNEVLLCLLSSLPEMPFWGHGDWLYLVIKAVHAAAENPSRHARAFYVQAPAH